MIIFFFFSLIFSFQLSLLESNHGWCVLFFIIISSSSSSSSSLRQYTFAGLVVYTRRKTFGLCLTASSYRPFFHPLLQPPSATHLVFFLRLIDMCRLSVLIQITLRQQKRSFNTHTHKETKRKKLQQQQKKLISFTASFSFVCVSYDVYRPRPLSNGDVIVWLIFN